MKWKGAFRISELIDNCMSDKFPKIPEENGVYLISINPWEKEPKENCKLLYVGSNTGQSKRFRTRVGDLIADMFGFYGIETGHHSGGQTLHDWCRENKLNPTKLYIGWLENCNCVRCAEMAVYKQFNPPLNKNRPTRCREHEFEDSI